MDRNRILEKPLKTRASGTVDVYGSPYKFYFSIKADQRITGIKNQENPAKCIRT